MALSHGLNANLLRRWVAEHERFGYHDLGQEETASTRVSKPAPSATFVPVRLPGPSAPPGANGARVANRALLADLLTGALQGKGKDEWVRIFNENKVSCGPINTVADLDNDPQVLARDIIVKMEHPQTGTVKTAASPLRFSRTPVTYRIAPPLIGEHSEDVLRDWLNVGDAELKQLKETKVI